MNRISFILAFFAVSLSVLLDSCGRQSSESKLSVNDQEYLSKPGLSVLAFHNYYTTGHQGVLRSFNMMSVLLLTDLYVCSRLKDGGFRILTGPPVK